MNIFPDYIALAFTLGVKVQLSPSSVAMLVALGLCVAIVWRFCKRKI
jgi:hypothetical protein